MINTGEAVKTMIKKRVLNLYRVSTKMQVKENDIPMQRAECTKYIRSHADWELSYERSEKGISGFKHTAGDRDVLNEIMELAVKREFDILLVYMSDRLGRREDDTPFFVADLNRLGIEVWSVKEGQLKTQEHIDKLLNYIRFWNAEGESLKTSIRVRDAQIEMLKRGEYTGGGCPYGYEQVYSGKHNNKGRPLKKLVIKSEEAVIIQKIFRLSTLEGMGGASIARELNSCKIPTKKDSKWTGCTINNILRNPIYKGYYTYGKEKTKGRRGRTPLEQWILSERPNPELIIIEEEFWDKAQKVRAARTPAASRKESVSFTASTQGRLLLTGLAFCGCCGSRLTNGSAYDRWKTKDGITHKKIRGQYKCIAKSEGASDCFGKANYKQELLEETVLDVVFRYGNLFDSFDCNTEFHKKKLELEQSGQRELQFLQTKIKAAQKDTATLKNQLPLAIRGEFPLSLKELQELILEKKNQLEELNLSFLTKQQNLTVLRGKLEELTSTASSFPKREIFEGLNITQKRLFLSALIKRIEVREEEIKIQLRIPLEGFQNPLPPSSDSDVSTSH